MKKTLEQLLAREAQLKSWLVKLEREIRKARRVSLLKCSYCNQQTMVKDAVFIQYYGYEPPQSCTAGDYYYESDIGWECPICNRTIKKRRKYHELGDSQESDDFKELIKLKYLFREIKKLYPNRYGSYEK